MALDREELASTTDAFLSRIKYFRDMGLTDYYQRPVDENSPLVQIFGAGAAQSVELPLEAANIESECAPTHTDASAVSPTIAVSSFFPSENANTLEGKIAALSAIRAEIGDCTRCALHKGRNKIVFGDGSPMARILFVGEGPGADEDAQGVPFVGQAGQLLNNMIAAMGLKREEVYIANVVKCRPPGNRNPEPEETNTCSPFLTRQIITVAPELIVALGATAATYLLGHKQPLAGLRGRVLSWRGTKLVVTYHPAYLLRDPRQKKEAWADLQIAMHELGLKQPQKNGD